MRHRLVTLDRILAIISLAWWASVAFIPAVQSSGAALWVTVALVIFDFTICLWGVYQFKRLFLLL
jgi:hypothetical protein